MVKSISLSRKNTIQSSENFVGTDWIFQQILSISAAKHVDGWLSKKQKDDVASMIASDNFIRF